MIYIPPFGMLAGVFGNKGSTAKDSTSVSSEKPYEAPDPKKIPKGTIVYGRYGSVKGEA